MEPSSVSEVAVGTQAPDFELFSSDLDPWRLSDQEGSPVVLFFFPGAFTSVCTTELNTINETLDDFGDAEVVAISTDSPFVLDEFRSVHGFDFPLLSDHDAEVSALYGAKYDNDFTPMKLDRISKRAAFVVDADGTIRYVEVLDNAGNQPDFDAIHETLEDL
jgi:peroxiredoxin